MNWGIIGSGSWGTALAKMLTDNGHSIHWCVRNETVVNHLTRRHHNPHYLSSVYFDTTRLALTVEPARVVASCDHIIIVTPSAYVIDQFEEVEARQLENRKIVSAVKGILPVNNLLLNDFLAKEFDFPVNDYFTIMGPCHAEEVAAEKLSYLTFSGRDNRETEAIAACFRNDYINVVINQDIYGVQYAAIMKNIYALGSGIAHGLEYGDNFLSVFIANAADEMAVFLRTVGILNIEVGVHEAAKALDRRRSPNYAASVYLGDLLVTCYSLFSRNRTFGTMIGKGYSVRAALLETNMVAEGYNASRCIHEINHELKSDIPLVETIYQILWEGMPAEKGFRLIEEMLV